MLASVIKHRLNLALALINTTTGHVVTERDSDFFILDAEGPRLVRMSYRDDGIFLLADSNCDKMFRMRIKVKGYETCEISINLEELSEVMPIKEVFLIPSENAFRMDELLTLRDNLPGLKKMSAVSMTDILAHTDRYDKRRRVMSLFERGYKLNMEGSPYGVIHTKENIFDIVEVAEQPDTSSVKLKDPYQGNLPRNAPVARVILGMVFENGDYIFRVLRDNRHSKFLLRFETEEKVLFREYDFADPAELNYMEEESEEEIKES